MLRVIFEKILKGEKLTDAEMGYFLQWAEKATVLAAPPAQNVTIIEQNLTPLETMVIQVVDNYIRGRTFINNLGEISSKLGLVLAGEFRVGNDKVPGDGFTGGRFGFPGFTYSAVDYFLAGVANDVLQVGLSLADGKIHAGAGNVTLDSTGIVFRNNAQAIIFRNAADDGNAGLIYADSSNNFWLSQQTPGGSIFLPVTPADNTGYFALKLKEHGSIPGVGELALVRSGITSFVGYAFHLNDIHLWSGQDGETTIFNDDNNDVDFRIEGSTDDSLFKVDAGLDAIGIGGAAESGQKLKVTGSVRITDGLTWDGWQKMADTWTRTGNHTFTVSGDVTADPNYAKGIKVKYNDGAVDYGVIGSTSYSAPNTTVTLITNDDYAMAAATITGTYISKIEKPDGWPDWFDYSPTYSASGSMTYTSVTTSIAKWRSMGANTVMVKVRGSGTTGGTASNTIRASLPIDCADAASFPTAFGQINDGGPVAARCAITGGTPDTLDVVRYDNANIGLGAGRVMNAAAIYEI